MKQFVSAVAENREIAPGWRLFSFEWPEGLEAPKPGQFFTVRPSSRGTDPLLRRPFAFSGFDGSKGMASFIFQVRGRSTEMLSELAVGATSDFLGPLGKGFPEPVSGGYPVLMAGGIGFGPVLYYSRYLASLGVSHAFLFGVRSAEFIPTGIDYPENTIMCTDNGTAGLAGNPVEAWKAQPPNKSEILFACGPHALLKGCRDLSRERNVPCFVSMEQTMACGVGACMGCAVLKADNTTYFRACSDGPVFDAEELSWK